ncbi:hypothetical protein C5N14_03560 [Micromonospora sp. MW-13]|uniref:DUF397 domain-containing protein n=1 Tax=Micromonospora sp. MW-13 TaxID=2094022 RepID=UPI000E4522F6|nr:hypothetical protein C5N14_03560 [Micromonospora sp. MW-13]
MTEPTRVTWRESIRSGGSGGSGGNGVEVADNLPAIVGVRNSKEAAGPVLRSVAAPGRPWSPV